MGIGSICSQSGGAEQAPGVGPGLLPGPQTSHSLPCSQDLLLPTSQIHTQTRRRQQPARLGFTPPSFTPLTT